MVSITTKNPERPRARGQQNLDLAHAASQMAAALGSWGGRSGGASRGMVAPAPGVGAAGSEPFPAAAAAEEDAACSTQKVGIAGRERCRGCSCN